MLLSGIEQFLSSGVILSRVDGEGPRTIRDLENERSGPPATLRVKHFPAISRSFTVLRFAPAAQDDTGHDYLNLNLDVPSRRCISYLPIGR
jgi:hypothetical protein